MRCRAPNPHPRRVITRCDRTAQSIIDAGATAAGVLEHISSALNPQSETSQTDEAVLKESTDNFLRSLEVDRLPSLNHQTPL